ncbi:MAG: PmoA family protein [Verrucomicrobia bacterium]|nr:PmoA family protein [Verrucomicrobiota bacterium]
MTTTKNRLMAWGFSLLTSVAVAQAGPFAKKGVEITPHEKKISITVDGQLLTEYHFAGVKRPYFWPLYGPDQAVLTRGFPLEPGPDDATDHIHHVGLWFTHGNVNGHDFWHDSDIQHAELIEYTSGSDFGQFTVSNHWVDDKGGIVCTDRRQFRVHRSGNSSRLFEYLITITASHGEVTFGDTKEGSMAIRLAPTMRVDGKVGKGSILTSEGIKNGDTWGKRAKWVDYYGPVQGKVYGVAMLDHPSNPRHPTWWHVRTYGLFAANPFGIHDFEKKPKGAGDFVLRRDESATFRYGFILHEGPANEEAINAIYEAWTHHNH